MKIKGTEGKVRAPVTRQGLRMLVCAAGLVLAGCATGPTANPRDPLEPMNRGIFQFNETVDEALLKPVAEGYKAVTPRLVRTGVTNFFNNLGDVWSMVNNLLQAKPKNAVESYFRIAVNTLMGLGGVLDIASDIGVEPHKEDFGQTLGRWGFPSGPYLVLPLLGPSSLRDAIGAVPDTFGYPVSLISPVPLRNTLIGLDAVDKRAGLLRAGTLLDESALDKYTFRRDVYLQKRRNDVFDGSPPEEELPEEPADLADPVAAPDPAAPATPADPSAAS